MLDISKIYKSKNNGDFKVVNYFGWNNVEGEFIDTGYRTSAHATHIRSGNVKDKYFPSVFGVGFVGKGTYLTKLNGKLTLQYVTWKSMLQRCYSENFQARQSTYKGCVVSTEWHNFQYFCLWFDENYSEGKHLDKDIKIDGNKIYSPEFCLFVSKADNTIKAHAKNYAFINPTGEVVKIYNLAEFCRDHNLNYGTMRSVHGGIFNQHKGWVKHTSS